MLFFCWFMACCCGSFTTGFMVDVHKSHQNPISNGYKKHVLVQNVPRGGSVSRRMLPAAVTSVVAGSIAGAIGVGVAFPLDTLKTKTQVLRQQGDSSAVLEKQGMLSIFYLIYKSEGLQGFFGGVRGMMVGQAFIKALAFSTNQVSLDMLQPLTPVLTSVVVLTAAACFSGFVTSFLVAPIERVKVMMQASSSYENELDCAKAVLQTEGVKGLLGRGLGPTLAREVPSYGIYFVLYGYAMNTSFASLLGPTAPLLFGALSGMAAWIPVYPVDVVKTLVQNTKGGSQTLSAWQVSKELYRDGGVGAFFDGLTPKMLRAAVNHSVTFFIYDLVMKTISS